MMRVGISYDPIYLEHKTGNHPENPRRLEETVKLLKSEGVFERLRQIPTRPASHDELLLVHDESHIRRVESFSRAGGGWLDADTVLSPESYEVALYAAGALLRAVDELIRWDIDSIFCLVRPPGHHATPLRAMGFCLFNNIAIAAKYAIKEHGINRVLIVDFDVHHGNGTQEIFYDDPDVLYFSTHQYPFYPGTGTVDETGHGAGKGKCVNIPLPAYSGDEEYIRVYEEILVPIAERFAPEFIMVSAGYDPHWADELALMQLTTHGFARIVEIIKNLSEKLCPGKLLFTLEGGYNLTALSHSILATLKVLMGERDIKDPLGKPRIVRKPPSIEPIIEAVKRVHNLP